MNETASFTLVGREFTVSPVGLATLERLWDIITDASSHNLRRAALIIEAAMKREYPEVDILALIDSRPNTQEIMGAFHKINALWGLTRDDAGNAPVTEMPAKALPAPPGLPST